MRLDVHHYEILAAVERTASISAAARDRGIDQASVSRTLRRIESTLGVVIFERDASGVHPTPAGREILATARVALEAVRRLEDRRPPLSHLRILLAHSCSDFLAPLRELRPELDVETAEMPPEAGVEALLSGAADVLIGIEFPHTPWRRRSGVSEVPVGSEHLVLALPSEHPQAAHEVVDLAELADEEWVVDDSVEIVRLLRGECRTLGGFEPRIRHRADGTTKELLLDGAGVGLVSELMMVEPRCVKRPYRGASPCQEYLCHVDGALPPAVVADVVRAVRRSNELLDAEVAQLRAAAHDRDGNT